MIHFNQLYQTHAAVAGLLMLILGCEEDATTMRLLVYEKQADAYAFDDVDIITLNDVHRLDGDATILMAGLSLVLNYAENTLDWKEEADNVAFSAIKEDGVLVPSSFDSLAMASIYYHMELSYLFFKDEFDFKEGVLKRLPTYYIPEIVEIDSSKKKSTMTDNAFYMKISNNERGFFIVPFKDLQWIPISLNSGIITHEYSHYVFDKLLMDNLPSLDSKSQNFLRALNEAVADYMAVARTSDPDFMAHSIPPNLFVTPNCNALKNMELSRDIAHPITRNYTSSMDAWAREVQEVNEYCPYELGSMISGMFYEIAKEIDTDDEASPSDESMLQVAKWILQFLPILSVDIRSDFDFELWDMFNRFVDEIEDDRQKQIACDIIEKRYLLYFSEVTGC